MIVLRHCKDKNRRIISPRGATKENGIHLGAQRKGGWVSFRGLMSESGFEGYIGVRQVDKGGSRPFKAGRTQESRGRVDHGPLRSCKEFCAAIGSSDTR